MTPEIVRAERAHNVRQAAHAWRRAGFVDDAVWQRVVSMYPDDRNRMGLGFRLLTYVFTGVGLWGAIALSALFIVSSLSDTGDGLFLLIWAATCATLSEFLRGVGRRSQAGAETCSAHMALALGIAGTLMVAGVGSDALFVAFLIVSLLGCVVAALRWGGVLFFFGAGISGFVLLAQTPYGRAWWMAVSLLLIVGGLKASRDIRVAPSHRRGASIITVVAIAALYAAVHIWSLDQQWIERMNVARQYVFDATPAAWSYRPLFILATVLLPPALLLIGWRRREPILLYGGLILIGLSIATIRLYAAVMPLSIALIAIGIACLALGLSVRRLLRASKDGEVGGFTADPLLDNANRTEAIRSVVALASFTPATQAQAAPDAFRGEGGGFGGAGASGNF